MRPSTSPLLSSWKEPKAKRVLGLTSVTFLVYFNVCGGPWGSEEMVSDAGPLPGMIGIFVFALLWGLPVASITSELSSCFPDDGGYSLWVSEAFGPFWGFQESYYSWISGVVDNAIYPGIVYSGIINVIGSAQIDHSEAGVDTITKYMQQHPGYKYLAKLTIATLFMLPNLFYVRGIGRSSAYLAAFVMAPFIVLIGVSFPFIEPSRLLLPPWNVGSSNSTANSTTTYRPYTSSSSSSSSIIAKTNHFFSSTPPSPSSSPSSPSNNSTGYFGYPQTWGSGWSDLFSVLYWNLSGFDCISTCAGEVKNVGYTIPRALAIAIILIVMTYVFPLAFSTMATDPRQVPQWGNDDGECSWSCIARNIGGEWIMYWVLIASIAGNGGMYIAEMFEDSWQLFGMAQSGTMPSIFGQRHPKYKTPFNAVLASYILISGLCYFDFMDNLSINNFFSCGSCLLEILAFIKLRHSRPNMNRPFRIPLSLFGVILLSLLPIILGLFVLVSSCTQSISASIMNMVAFIFGVVLFYCMRDCGGYEYNYNYKRQRLLSENNSQVEEAATSKESNIIGDSKEGCESSVPTTSSNYGSIL